MRSTGRFVRRNRLQFIVAGVAAAVVGVTAVAGAGVAPRVDAVTTEASAVDDFPTELFQDPLGEADTGNAEVADPEPGNVDGGPSPEATPAPEVPDAPAPGGGSSEPDSPAPPVNDEEPPLGAEALEFSVRLTPDEVGADGTFYAEVVARNTGDRLAKATVSSIDYSVVGEDGSLFTGTISIPLPVSVEAGGEWSMGVHADPFFLAAYASELPEVIEAGTYTADVTINVEGIAPVHQTVTLTFTESIDLLARATEQCQALIDSWGEWSEVVIDSEDGESDVAYFVASSGGLEGDLGSDPIEPPTLEECLTWYGY